ncbi:uncharacterized protein LOC111628978 [Centruroides sculpturatus]|uniref:uncharacterized protein LOC111628978 n=1 Tax=Centruroides sculpturatus TaxID=218467 RepID=UPI000C6EB79E|nr:uncharacterized protein LOC111628978 [Centruroides sculpturatus]
MTRYLNSVFLDHSTADDLCISQWAFRHSLDLAKILHICMDRLNVNISFLNKLEDHMETWNVGNRLENGECLECAAEVVESVKTYINNSTKLKDSKVATFLRQVFNNPFIKVKLLFFWSICTQSESFLTQFQSNKPLAPYLYKAVVQLLMNLMRKLVKNDRVTDKQFLKIDLNDNENLVSLKNLDIGFGAKKVLKELKVSIKDILCFLRDCQNVLKVMTQKIIEKGPVKYKCVKALSSLDPEIIKMQSNVGKLYFSVLLEVLHDTSRIDGNVLPKQKNSMIYR